MINSKPNEIEESFAKSLLSLMVRYNVVLGYDPKNVPVFHNWEEYDEEIIFLSIHDLYRVMYNTES